MKHAWESNRPRPECLFHFRILRIKQIILDDFFGSNDQIWKRWGKSTKHKVDGVGRTQRFYRRVTGQHRLRGHYSLFPSLKTPQVLCQRDSQRGLHCLTLSVNRYSSRPAPNSHGWMGQARPWKQPTMATASDTKKKQSKLKQPKLS